MSKRTCPCPSPPRALPSGEYCSFAHRSHGCRNTSALGVDLLPWGFHALPAASSKLFCVSCTFCVFTDKENWKAVSSQRETTLFSICRWNFTLQCILHACCAYHSRTSSERLSYHSFISVIFKANTECFPKDSGRGHLIYAGGPRHDMHTRGASGYHDITAQ